MGGKPGLQSVLTACRFLDEKGLRALLDNQPELSATCESWPRLSETPLLVHSALIGRAGEMLVAAELMRRGIEVAQPHSDVGVDLMAYRLRPGSTVPIKLAPIQVKSASAVSFNFQKSWLKKSSNLVLVWKLAATTTPEFYVFDRIERIEEALGDQYKASKSWMNDGVYSVTHPNTAVIERMQNHRDQWNRIETQL